METPQFMYNNGQMDGVLDHVNEQAEIIDFLNDEIKTMRETVEQLVAQNTNFRQEGLESKAQISAQNVILARLKSENK